MRDEIDARMWNDHHEEFSERLDRALRRHAERAARSLRIGGGIAARVPGQLLAALAAVSLTLATFSVSAI